MAQIILKNLTKIYQKQQALVDLNLSISPGEILALLGPNGAGKTTTLGLIAGFIQATKGEILIDGQPHQGMESPYKNMLGFVTENMSLYHKLSIKESLLLLTGLRKIPREVALPKLYHLAESFDMSEHLHKSFDKLSAGQKRKALFISAIIHDPEILILDEITASLDMKSAKTILDFLSQEKKRGKAILFSTHIMSEAEYLSDRMAILSEGHLVEVTTAKSLKERFRTESLMAAMLELLAGEKKAA